MDIKYLDDVGTRHLIEKNKNTFIKKVDIVDNCISDNSEAPLSASQGKHLQTQIANMETEVGEQLKSSSAETLTAAKSYTDTKTASLASASSVNTSITNHNTATEAHNDIRELISDLSTEVNNFLDVDDATKDQLSEVLELIENNKGTLDSLTTNKVNVSDVINNLTTNSSSKVLSAAQGVAIKNLIDTLETGLSDKADAEHIHVAVTATSTDGVTYTATVPGIDELNVGASFIMIPSMTSTSIEPTLDVNGLGAINIRRRLSAIATLQQQGYSAGWLTVNLPFRLVYDGTYWIVEGYNRPVAADLYGIPAAAIKATQDANGNVITDTYATVEYVDTLIGIILNGAS